MKQHRFHEIDLLRGLAIFVMILIHTDYYFLETSRSAQIQWEFSQFAVPAFVFCSAFIFLQRDTTYFVKDFLGYIKKRFTRLLIPYYVFAPLFMLILYWKDPTQITSKYIRESLMLTGGIEINWLVLLFLFFVFLIPFIQILEKKNKIAFWGFFGISVLSSVYFIFHPVANSPFWASYKPIMWLSWSVMLYFTWYFIKYRTASLFYPLTLVFSLSLYIVLLFTEIKFHHNLSFYDNKYPPTLYLHTYGIFCVTLFFLIAQKKLLPASIDRFLIFLSTNSYSLYFIHYGILTMLTSYLGKVHFTWVSFFLAVFLPTVLVQLGINEIKARMALSKNAV